MQPSTSIIDTPEDPTTQQRHQQLDENSQFRTQLQRQQVQFMSSEQQQNQVKHKGTPETASAV